MRLTLWLLAREILSVEIGRPPRVAEVEYVSNLAAEIEPTTGDDGTRYAPGFDADQCFEERMGFWPRG